jgi:serine protease
MTRQTKSHSRLMRGIALISATVLVSSLTIAGVAAAQPRTVPSADSVSAAVGLIIHTSPNLGVAATDARLRAGGLDAARVMSDTYRLDFDEPVMTDEVNELMADIRALPGVLDVERDILLTPATPQISAAPQFPNDPLFGDQWYLWDSREADGGFSLRAPKIWPRTTGSPDAVVAVIDTGYAAHPDLEGRVITGYDFVSDVAMANDGDAWDPDPSDPGDWVTAADLASGTLPATCVVSPGERSTWHGTHVMGVINAIQNNGYGISGTAPSIRVLNVRALGKCGGRVSDIAAAVAWSVGETVFNPDTGMAVPVNTTPAQVINLSLGGPARCSDFTSLQNAITRARDKGAVVVAAAGNDNKSVSTFLPANCTSVVAVAATARDGSRTSYSNFGEALGQMFIAAPGGDAQGAIVSTFNSGAQGPVAPTFAAKAGTSLAAPLVSASAALLYSSGFNQPQAVIDRLSMSVQAFPATETRPCTRVLCGAGILDLDRLLDPINLQGRRGIVRDRHGVIVDATTFGLPEGMRVTPFIKFPGQTRYSAGTGTRTVSAVTGDQGSFTWQRQTGKKIYVYFRAENGERSQRIIIPGR